MTDTIKYLIKPGYEKKPDGSYNFMSAEDLIKAYKVKETECKIGFSSVPVGSSKLILLTTRDDGDYKLPELPSNQKTIKHKSYTEILFHFTCGNCANWWSIGDWIPVPKLTCPVCSSKLDIEQGNKEFDL